MAADESKARLRDEVAALSETVRELRDEVARLHAGQHGCGCAHVCTHPAWQPMWWQPTQIWCNTGAAGGNTPYNVSITDTSLSYTTTNAAAGAPGMNTQILDVTL